ncbi:Uncharacterised protein [Klebsiella pneumoniae]|uniref:Uncharacterized protein n=1 Tax=Klebsiella pneumoniae TaxID=573 RepID=A0A377XLH9_KLEPN|nr:Uncharacterised protein [Klebsiella pneumoniae]
MRVLTESQRHGAVHRTAEGAINLGQLQAADRGVQSGLPPLRAPAMICRQRPSLNRPSVRLKVTSPRP